MTAGRSLGAGEGPGWGPGLLGKVGLRGQTAPGGQVRAEAQGTLGEDFMDFHRMTFAAWVVVQSLEPV